MTKESYEKLSAPFRKNARRLHLVSGTNKILTVFIYVVYIALLILTFLAVCMDRPMGGGSGTGEPFVYRLWNSPFLRVFLIPAVSFWAVTFLRKAINAPRPYELLDIDPLIKKDTQGHSFPSRHVFSIFVIAVSVLYIWVPGGIVLLCAGVVLAFLRVLGGVHFPKDVIAGALIGIGCGLLCFAL